MTRNECLRLAQIYFEDGSFFGDLNRRVGYATESDRGDAPVALAEYLHREMTSSLELLGFVCEVIPNPIAGKGPFMIARRIEGPQLPTVLTYGHGDVVSGQESQWRKDLTPWKVTVDGDKWYGRGCADNKGQHTINFAGLAAAIQARNGKLGYNVTVLLEMGEEAGSPGLREICDAQADRLKAQVFIACDGPRLKAKLPTVFLGSRGAVNFALRLRCRERAYHSGNWGGVLRNPAMVLAHALASLVDMRGRILIDQLKPAAIPTSIKEALRHLDIGGEPDDPQLDADWGEPGLTAAERLMAWNTLEVLAWRAGNAQRPVNAIPGMAEVHCQLRFVVGTPWQSLGDILRQHLSQHGFEDVEVEIGMTAAASRLEPDHPWVQWACASLRGSCGQLPVVLPNLAGTLPNDLFAETLGLPTLWIPHSYPACAQHAPNEHLLSDVALEGLQIMAGLYWDLGQTMGQELAPPWTRDKIS